MASVPKLATFHTQWTDPVTLDVFFVGTRQLITLQAQLDRIESASVAYIDAGFNPTAPGPIGGTAPAAGAFTTLSATGILTLGSTISGNVDASGFVRGVTLNATATSGAAIYAKGGFLDIDDGTDRVTAGIASGAHVGTANSRDFSLRTNGANRLTFAGTGLSAHFSPGVSVGIGTTLPARALHVVGGARITALPTSSVGLSAGDLWNDGGTVKIV